MAALAGLNDAELQQWSALSAKAAVLALETPLIQAPPPDTAEKAFGKIGSMLPSAEQAAFAADIGRSDLSDERACSLFKTVFSNSQRLEPPLRADFYRVLAGQK